VKPNLDVGNCRSQTSLDGVSPSAKQERFVPLLNIVEKSLHRQSDALHAPPHVWLCIVWLCMSGPLRICLIISEWAFHVRGLTKESGAEINVL
jgi:hypothetical protein